MRFQQTFIFLSIVATLVGCTPNNDASNQSDTDAAIQRMAAGLPRKTDAATTLVEVRSDGQGGVIYVDSIDTTMVNLPSQDKLKEMLCGVRSDSPPQGNHSPFTGLTFVYRDLQGSELTRVHFGRGECPGQAM